MQTLNPYEASAVAGGHIPTEFTIIGLTTFAVTLPHTLIGTIEFYNYTAEWIDCGCTHFDQDDYFRKHSCTAVKAIAERAVESWNWMTTSRA